MLPMFFSDLFFISVVSAQPTLKKLDSAGIVSECLLTNEALFNRAGILPVFPDFDKPDAKVIPERLFDKFYKTSDAEGSGTGLGLSIIKLLVEKMGGKGFPLSFLLTAEK